MRFAPEYVTYVLNENFEDAKELFLSPLIAIHYAHLVMLASQRIVSPDDAHALRVALDTLSQDEVRRTKYDPACEDLFYYVERLIVAASGNTYGSIATVDYLLESTSATSVLLAGLGRFVQDLLLWGTSEFGYVRFGDGFVQSSSIMPQKRNPVAIEHARAIGSKALGQAQAVFTSVHNTPFGDIVDTEDDLQPLVFSMFRDATRSVKLVAAAMATAEFDATSLESRAAEGWTTLTELADTLVRD